MRSKIIAPYWILNSHRNFRAAKTWKTEYPIGTDYFTPQIIGPCYCFGTRIRASKRMCRFLQVCPQKRNLQNCNLQNCNLQKGNPAQRQFPQNVVWGGCLRLENLFPTEILSDGKSLFSENKISFQNCNFRASGVAPASTLGQWFAYPRKSNVLLEFAFCGANLHIRNLQNCNPGNTPGRKPGARITAFPSRESAYILRYAKKPATQHLQIHTREWVDPTFSL